MTRSMAATSRPVRVAALLLIAALAAGPVGTHVYWMLGGTWGLYTLSGAREEVARTGTRVVAAVVIVAAGRCGVGHSGAGRVVAASASCPSGWFGSSRGRWRRSSWARRWRASPGAGTTGVVDVRAGFAPDRSARVGRGGLGWRVASLAPAAPDAAVALKEALRPREPFRSRRRRRLSGQSETPWGEGAELLVLGITPSSATGRTPPTGFASATAVTSPRDAIRAGARSNPRTAPMRRLPRRSVLVRREFGGFRPCRRGRRGARGGLASKESAGVG